MSLVKAEGQRESGKTRGTLKNFEHVVRLRGIDDVSQLEKGWTSRIGPLLVLGR